MLCCYCLAHGNWNQYWSKSPVPLRSGSPQLLLYILYIQKPAAIPFLLLEQINGGGREKSTYIWQECCWQQFYACQDGALGRRVSLFSKGSRLFEMAVRQEKQLKAHTLYTFGLDNSQVQTQYITYLVLILDFGCLELYLLQLEFQAISNYGLFQSSINS